MPAITNRHADQKNKVAKNTWYNDNHSDHYQNYRIYIYKYISKKSQCLKSRKWHTPPTIRRSAGEFAFINNTDLYNVLYAHVKMPTPTPARTDLRNNIIQIVNNTTWKSEYIMKMLQGWFYMYKHELCINTNYVLKSLFHKNHVQTIYLTTIKIASQQNRKNVIFLTGM